MSARSKARKRALDLLYGSDLLDRKLTQLIEQENLRALSEPSRKASWDYARQILWGVDDNYAEIDSIIAESSKQWSIHRMPIVDRNILRIGVWEILHNPEIPDSVAISEALELATELSTEGSAKFINGILANISKQKTN